MAEPGVFLPYQLIWQLALSFFIWDIAKKLIEHWTGNTPTDKITAIGDVADKMSTTVANKAIELAPKIQFVKDKYSKDPLNNLPLPTTQDIQIDVSEQISLLLTHVEHNQRNIDILMEKSNIKNGNESIDENTENLNPSET